MPCRGWTMRGTWALVVLILAGAGAGCHDKPRRLLRQPDVQIYDLPPSDERKFSEPPTYPEEKRAPLQPGKDNSQQPGLRLPGGGGGGMGGPGMGGPGGGLGGGAPGGRGY
jgi:hypothetical protein